MHKEFVTKNNKPAKTSPGRPGLIYITTEQINAYLVKIRMDDKTEPIEKGFYDLASARRYVQLMTKRLTRESRRRVVRTVENIN